MAQTSSLEPRGLMGTTASHTAISVAQSGNTTLLEVITLGVEKVSFQVDNTVQALDAFAVEGRVHPDATYFTIASVAADFSAPSGRMLKAVGAMVTLAASASGAFDVDTSGLYSVRVTASGGNATPSVVSIYASGSGSGASNINATLTAGDIELGAVEIKNGTTDARGTVLAASTAVATTDTALVVENRPIVTQAMSTALEASRIFKASAGSLRQLTIFNSKASAQFILVLNSATLTGDGPVTLLYPPIPIAAASIVALDIPAPIVASAGITVCNSSTGSFTKTIGAADCVFFAQYN